MQSLPALDPKTVPALSVPVKKRKIEIPDDLPALEDFPPSEFPPWRAVLKTEIKEQFQKLPMKNIKDFYRAGALALIEFLELYQKLSDEDLTREQRHEMNDQLVEALGSDWFETLMGEVVKEDKICFFEFEQYPVFGYHLPKGYKDEFKILPLSIKIRWDHGHMQFTRFQIDVQRIVCNQ